MKSVSEAQDGLADDAPLDLGGASVDGHLAVVEVVADRIDRGRGQLREAVAGGGRVDEVQALRAEHVDEQLRDVLLQLRAVQLEDGRARVWLVVPGALRG